jgi:hypothetical protein
MPSASASEWNKKTIVTFSAPVEIPGKALPAGTYVFKLLDATANRNIVQVYDKNQQHLIATVLAVPDYRRQPTGKPLVEFEERPTGTPEAIEAWFYPGDNYGQMFVYPHARAMELARRTHQNVLSMRDEMETNTHTSATSASDSGIRQLQQTDVTAVSPTGQEVGVDSVVSQRPVR